MIKLFIVLLFFIIIPSMIVTFALCRAAGLADNMMEENSKE